MRRREFIRLIGAAAAWPLAAHGQQLPVVGFLSTASPAAFAHLVAAFQRGLQETGFVEGRNVVIEYRWAQGDYNQLPALAADLVRRGVAVIVTSGGETPTVVAKAATASIPIVFNVGSDPVKIGTRRQSRPARRQCDWSEHLHRRALREAFGIAERRGARRGIHGSARQPELCARDRECARSRSCCSPPGEGDDNLPGRRRSRHRSCFRAHS